MANGCDKRSDLLGSNIRVLTFVHSHSTPPYLTLSTTNRNSMATFAAPSSVITPSANPSLERIVVRGQILDSSFPLEGWCGAQPQGGDTVADPFSDCGLYLSMYDLCRGDNALLDAIRGPAPAPPMPPLPIVTQKPVVPPPPAPSTITAPCSTPGPSTSLSSATTHPPTQGRRASNSAFRARDAPYSRAGMSQF
jgi:hypothetical protein